MAPAHDGPRIEYTPPAYEELVQFARSVGQRLGEDYAQPEIVHGLAGFIAVVARLVAGDLNRRQG